MQLCVKVIGCKVKVAERMSGNEPSYRGGVVLLEFAASLISAEDVDM